MPDKLASSEPSADLLRHHVPPRLRLVGLVAIGLAVIVIVIGLGTRFFGDRSTKAWTEEQAVPTVQLVTLQGSKGGDFVLPGDIQAFTTATIYAQISGYVQKWFVDIGTPVKAGQVLAQIDSRTYQAALDQARGQLARDAATLTNAKLDLNRYQALASQNAISAQQLSTQQAAVGSSSGIVEADRAAVEAAQINMGYTRIIAPFDGVVTSRAVDVGQLVTVGNQSATPLFTVTDQNHLRIYVRLPQSYSGLIHDGMTVTFNVPEYPGRVFTATLAATANAIVSQSGTELIQLQIDNADHALKPGSYAEMHFAMPRGSSGVRVPATALIFREAGMMVATVDKNSRVVMKPIRIASDFGTTVEVGAGLKQGDKVIDNPPDSMRAGDAVRVVSKPQS